MNPSLSSAPSREVDFLAALAPRGLALVLALGVVGAAAGYAAARAFLHHHEARGMIRVATVGMAGAVVPMTELKARAESRALIIEALRSQHAPDPEGMAMTYRVLAETDGAHDATVVTFQVSGPDANYTLGLAKAVVEAMARHSHEAYAKVMGQYAEQLQRADKATDAFRAAAAGRLAPGMVAESTAAAMDLERWAGEVANLRRRAEGEVLESRDSEVIDPPYLRDSNLRQLLLAALGAFGGMLLGLSLATRPARSP